LHVLGSGPYEGKLRELIKNLDLEKSVTMEHIAPDDRKRMAVSLSAAAVFTAISEYEANPVAVMEALTMGIPIVGLDTAGIGDLVKEGFVRGVPKDASSATIAQALITTLSDRRVRDPAPPLGTWDTAATELAHIYRDVVGCRRELARPSDL
jgi:glycosyltransferase involved in cell wall biosynthesis